MISFFLHHYTTCGQYVYTILILVVSVYYLIHCTCGEFHLRSSVSFAQSFSFFCAPIFTIKHAQFLAIDCAQYPILADFIVLQYVRFTFYLYLKVVAVEVK